MKKSLIAVAVASAFVAPAALAEVTLSGAINVGVQLGKSSSGSAPGSASLTDNRLGPSYSHMDIESVDDIGGGNKIVFHYQMDISGTSSAATTNAGGAIGNRNSFIGVVGDWGAFKMGTNENVYERMMYTADPLDGAAGVGGNLNILGTPGAGTVFEVGQAGCDATTGGAGCVGFYRRAEQQIWYESPNWSGFSFEVDYSLSAFKTQTTDPQIVSIGGKFQPEGAPFYIDLAYERHDDMFGLSKIAATTPGAPSVAGATGSKDTGMQIGGGWMFGDLGLHLRYERLKYENSGGALTEYKRDAYWIAAKYNLPSGYVGAEFGIAGDGDANGASVDNTGAKMFGIGYFHNLSRQSQLQMIYGRTDNDANATYLQIGAAGGAGQAGPGRDHQALTVAFKHTY